MKISYVEQEKLFISQEIFKPGKDVELVDLNILLSMLPSECFICQLRCV